MNTRTDQLIESYFSNTLTETEAGALRELLTNDPEAAREFDWRQRLAGEVNKLSLSDGIQNPTWKNSLQPPFRRPMIPWQRVLSAAAAIALLGVAYWFFTRPDKPAQTLQAIAESNFRYYPNKLPFNSLGGPDKDGETVSQQVLDAFQLYNDTTRFRESAQALGAVAAAFPEKLEYRFYQGVALLGDHQYAAAAAALQPLTETDNTYNTPALYYLGLAYTGAGDREQARKTLQTYIDSKDGITFRKQAQNALNALR